ncbi:MAG TPA: enoyl-CoA hydratase-related protein [Sphingobium sp.]
MSILLRETSGSVRLLRLNDSRRRNLLSGDLCRAISDAVAEANADPDIKAIVITGAPPAFCAGADLNDLEAAAAGQTDTLQAVYQSFMDVAQSALPTIAAVNGIAVGAGFNLALACDIRLASVDAQFDCRFLKIGLHPGGGHGWMLLRAVGWAEATRMLLLNRAVSAEEARAIGLVQDITEEADLVERAMALAGRSDALPRDLILRTKQTLRLAAASDHGAAFTHESVEQLHSLGEPPFKDLVKRLKGDMASRKL